MPCEAMLPLLEYACQYCATPLPSLAFKTCGHCIKQQPPIDGVYAPYRFEAPLRTLLHTYKYQEALYLAYFFVDKLKAYAPRTLPENTCFIPVPLHKKRLRARGFNQAALLAKLLAKHYQKPYLPSALRKIKNTPSQAKLEARERRNNLKQGFQIKPIPHAHVILVDDLITTGSTANEIARTIKKQHPAHVVSLWCIAKTCLD